MLRNTRFKPHPPDRASAGSAHKCGGYDGYGILHVVKTYMGIHLNALQLCAGCERAHTNYAKTAVGAGANVQPQATLVVLTRMQRRHC